MVPFADQEITDFSVNQEADATTITFTRPMAPADGRQVLSSTPGEVSRIIYAFGDSNVLAYHGPGVNADGFEVDLFCGDTVAGGVGDTPAPSSMVASVAPTSVDATGSPREGGAGTPSPVMMTTEPPAGADGMETATMAPSAVPTAAPTGGEETSAPATSASTDAPVAPTAMMEETAAPSVSDGDRDIGDLTDDATDAPDAAEDGSGQADATDAAASIGGGVGGGWAAAAVVGVATVLAVLSL